MAAFTSCNASSTGSIHWSSNRNVDNLTCSVLVLHSCNRLAAHDPFRVPFCLVLNCTLRTHHTQLPRLDPGFVHPSTFYRQMTDPSAFDSYGNPFLCGPLIYKSCKRAAGGSSCILVIDDSYQSCAFLPPDRLHTRAGWLCLALFVPLVTMVLVPMLPQNSLRPDNDLYRVPGSYTLHTILPPGLLSAVFVLVLTSTFASINFGPPLKFTELPTLGLVSRFCAATLLPPVLQLGLRSFVVIELTSDMALMMRQTKRSAAHLSVSYWPRE